NWIDDHGRYRIDGALDKLTGELLEQARRAVIAEMERTGTHPHADEPSDAGEPSDTADTAGAADAAGAAVGAGVSRRHVSAVESIAAMASTVLEHASKTGVGDRGGERFAVQVVCDIGALAEALGIDLDANVAVGLGSRAYLPRTGAHLNNTELSRVLCEGTLQMLIDHDGQPLWLGAEKRLFNRHQRRALRHRAGGQAACEFPGCPTTRFVETHHIASVAEAGGLTDLDNGVLLCSFHHHELHRKRWQIVRNGSQLTFYDRTRCLGSSGPPGPTPGPHADVAVLPLQTHPPQPPPDIGADSCRCHGGGEHLTAYALDGLLHHLLTAA
ncbi:MAG: HNH endonuclease, partial [Microthrixaceae bacterium]|nr:HNH endonuclease [Microthrixaceae bacterium]